jgi:F420H(2)-dependent quinone reductase
MTTLRTVRSKNLPPKAVMRVANVFVVALLNSPLHALLSKMLLVLTYTGRASGRRYRIPVGYRRDGALVTLVAGNPWWVNLRDGAAVTLRLAGTELRGTAIPLADKR